MCRQIFKATVLEGVGSPEEIAQLQDLENSHRMARELAENGDLYELPNDMAT